MKKSLLLSFGEEVDGYNTPVLNEREVRAAAGILFLIGVVGMTTVWLTGGLALTRIFVVAFFIDFVIRVFVNPMYAPSLVLGRIFVGGQKPEYVSASPKRFAWSIGLLLSLYMLISLVMFGIMTPFNLLICATCLALLFLETAFGICIGCLIYNFFKKDKSQICPGDICKDRKKESIQHVSIFHVSILASFLLLLTIVYPYVQIDFGQSLFTHSNEQILEEDWIVPQWAIDIGHEDIYKLHNNCE